MQDDPPQREDLNAKWGKIYQDILFACGKLVTVEGGIEFDSDENSVDLSEFDCDPNHSQAAQIFFPDDPPQDEPEESQSKTSDASGIIEDNNQSGVYMVGGLSLESGEVKAWDVEDDPNAATLLGTANEFDLDAGLENDIEDAMHPNTNEFDLDAENPSHSCMWSSSFDLTSDWRLCLSEILYCYRLYASFAFYTAMVFICFGALINNYLQILNNKQSLLVVLIWMASFWLGCLCCNFINFARRRRWYKKQESESSDVLDVSSLSDSMAPAPYTDGHGRKRFWYYKETWSDSAPKRIHVTTTFFVALCTSMLAVTSYQIFIFFNAL